MSVACIDGIPATPTMPAASGPFVAVTIGDTGSGIDEETLGRIFEPFFTTKELGKGTGLGLSVSQQIAAAHGGHIEATSTPGEGSVFRLVLPVAHGAEGPASRPEAP